MIKLLDSFAEIWCADFEFRAPDGERPVPVCLVATELRTGATVKLFADELSDGPPWRCGPDVLLVAYYSSAEVGCMLALNWPLTPLILDLFTEFRNLTNGLEVACGDSLLGALSYFGLDAIDAVEKDSMRQLAMCGRQFTEAERAALLGYCEGDVRAVAELLNRMLPQIDLPRALLRGRYMKAAAQIEWNGTPVDTTKYAQLTAGWDRLKSMLVSKIDAEYDIFVPIECPKFDPNTEYGHLISELAAQYDVGEARFADAIDTIWRHTCNDPSIEPSKLPKLRTDERIVNEAVKWLIADPHGDFRPRRFSAARFATWLERNDISWPRLDSGALDLNDDTFRRMAQIYPKVAPLRELRYSLSQLRLNSLAVGSDGRNRCLLSAFRSTTGRNQPSNTKFIFGPSCWLRALIQPPPGRALAYVDWEQQEFGIAAALSGDSNMCAAYSSGDPYLAFAKQAGAVPVDATKHSHTSERERFKSCALGVQYGMGEQSLSLRIGKPVPYARELLRLHRQTYPRFWEWSQAAVDHAMLHGWLQTVFGWRVHVGQEANPRSLANFPMQANGAEMLRLACCLATEAGVMVCAPVHDAVLIEADADADAIDAEVARMQGFMREASEVVLSGFPLRTDANVIRHPDRYLDPRGVVMWEHVSKMLSELPSGVATAHHPTRDQQSQVVRPEVAGTRDQESHPICLISSLLY